MTISLRKALLLTVATTGLLSGTVFASAPVEDPTKNPAHAKATHSVVAPAATTGVTELATPAPVATHHTSKFVAGLEKFGHEVETGIEHIGAGVEHLFQKAEKDAPTIEKDAETVAADAATVLDVVGAVTGNKAVTKAGGIVAASDAAAQDAVSSLSAPGGTSAANVIKTAEAETATITNAIGGNTAAKVNADVQEAGQVATNLAAGGNPTVASVLTAGATVATDIAAKTSGTTSTNATTAAAILNGVAAAQQAQAPVNAAVAAASPLPAASTTTVTPSGN